MSAIHSVLFTGAGASVSFDFPDMKVVVEQLVEELRTKKESEESKKTGNKQLSDISSLLDSIIICLERMKLENKSKKSWERIRGGYDLEEIFVFLKSLETTEYLLQCEPFNIGIKQKKLLSKRKALLELCKKTIVDKYGKFNGDISFAVSLYEPLLLSLLKRNNGSLSIFTTNYDSVIEDVCIELEIDLSRGLKPPFQGKHNEWAVVNFFDPLDESQKGVNLFQLHGAYDLERYGQKNDKFTFSVNPEYKPGKNVIIYPEKDKFPNEEPFFTYYDILQRCLENTNYLIVIGYSLRDLGIIMKIKSAVRKNQELKVVIIDPNITKQTIANYKSEFKCDVIGILSGFESCTDKYNYLAQLNKVFDNKTEETFIETNILNQFDNYLGTKIDRNNEEIIIYPGNDITKIDGFAFYRQRKGNINRIRFKCKRNDDSTQSQFGVIWIDENQKIYGLYAGLNDKVYGIYQICINDDTITYPLVTPFDNKMLGINDRQYIDIYFNSDSVSSVSDAEYFRINLTNNINRIGFCVYKGAHSFSEITIE